MKIGGQASRENKDDGGNNNSRCTVSKIVILACAVAAVAPLGHDDGNENTSIAFKVGSATGAAMVAYVLVDHFFRLFSSSISGPKTTEDDSNGWSFPPHGWIKCNVDGSAPEDKASGCGGVFRDSVGTWLYGFAESFDHCASSAAELLAISTALDIAWDRGYRKLILETDSLTAADVVNDRASVHSPYEKKLVPRIKGMRDQEWKGLQIVHSKRGGNQVADWLANLSHGLQVGDRIELLKLPDGCRSCHELMLEDTTVANSKGRSF